MNDTNGSEAPGSLVNFYLGLILALLSTIFIGCSFIVKKVALIRLEKCGTRASDGGFGYLRDWLWWLGLILIAVGEGSNFIAYAFAPASLVTPLGGLSVLVTAIMSSKFLQEHLNLIGKIGCIVCLSGSTIIVLHAPKEQEIQSMADLTIKFLNPAYLTYACMIILLAMLLIFYLAPRSGKTNPLIYLSISGTIGSLSVMSCKGIGVGIREAVDDPRGTVESPLFWILIVQLVTSILVQMNFLNKALDIFNTNIVTPLLYVIFTGSVLIASSLLFQEWSALTLEDHFGNICGLLCIVSGIFLITAFRELDVSWQTIRQTLRAGSSGVDCRKNKTAYDACGGQMGPTFRQRFLQQHARAFSDEFVIQHRMTDNVGSLQPRGKAKEDAWNWKRLYGSIQTSLAGNNYAHSTNSAKSYDSDPESGANVRLLVDCDHRKPYRFLATSSKSNNNNHKTTTSAKCASAPLNSGASSWNGSSSPNSIDNRLFPKPMHYIE